MLIQRELWRNYTDAYDKLTQILNDILEYKTYLKQNKYSRKSRTFFYRKVERSYDDKI